MHVAEGAREQQRTVPHRVLWAVHDEQRLVGRSAQHAVATEAVQQRIALLQQLPSGGDL